MRPRTIAIVALVLVIGTLAWFFSPKLTTASAALVAQQGPAPAQSMSIFDSMYVRVAPNGNIQNAVNQAIEAIEARRANDVVIVLQPGTYLENVRIHSNLRIGRGNDFPSLTLRPASTGTVTIDGRNLNTVHVSSSIRTVLRDLTIVSSQTTPGFNRAAVFAEMGPDIRIMGGEIRTANTGLSTNYTTATYLQGTTVVGTNAKAVGVMVFHAGDENFVTGNTFRQLDIGVDVHPFATPAFSPNAGDPDTNLYVDVATPLRIRETEKVAVAQTP